PQPWPDKPFRLYALDKGHAANATVRGADFSPDGRTLASVCSDGTLNLWDVPTGKVRHTAKRGGGFDHVEFSRDGKRFVTSGSDALVRLFDAATGKETATLR